MDSKNLIWQNGERSLYVFQFGRLGTHTGVFVNKNTKSAFLVDSPFGAHGFLANSLLRGFVIEALFITHAHWDHIGDDYLFRRDGAKIYTHGENRLVIENPSVLIPYVGSDMGLTPCKVDYNIGDNFHLRAAGVDVYARDVPGHSTGDVFFYIKCAGVAFVGDTLFRNCIGRTDLFGGNRELLISGIIEKILTLPVETLVIPGHGEFTTVGHECEHNNYLR
jgi:glyoxylase-like metal-dependent hydrolase (beta-lactamase superfamily II)